MFPKDPRPRGVNLGRSTLRLGQTLSLQLSRRSKLGDSRYPPQRRRVDQRARRLRFDVVRDLAPDDLEALLLIGGFGERLGVMDLHAARLAPSTVDHITNGSRR